MKNVIATIAVAMSFVATSAAADKCGFMCKLAYGSGHDTVEAAKSAWEDKSKASAAERMDRTGKTFEISGNYAYTKVGDEIVMVSKSDVIRAYQTGGTDKVVDLIGEQAAKDIIKSDVDAAVARGEVSSEVADKVKADIQSGKSLDAIKKDLNIEDEFIATAVDAAGNEINSLTIVDQGVTTTINGADFDDDASFQAAIDEAKSAIESVAGGITQADIDAFQADLQEQVESGAISHNEFNQKTEEFLNNGSACTSAAGC